MKRTIDRRSALTGLSALAVAPAFVPSTARGKDGAVAPSEKITMGCVGVGGMGTGNMRSFLSQSDCQVVAVCDVNGAHRDRARKTVNDKYGDDGCATYVDYRDLIARADIDTVMMATTDHWHGVVSVAAAKAGKDIYGEKPIGHTYMEGRRIADAVRRYGRVWQTGSWQRSQHNFARGAELAFNGRLGKISRVEVGLPSDAKAKQVIPYEMKAAPENLDWDFYVGPARMVPYHKELAVFNWRWNLNFGGGSILDWCGHHLDIAHWGLGCDHDSGPLEVEGSGEYQSRGIYNTAHTYAVTMRYPNDVTVQMNSAGHEGVQTGTKWIGDRGWVRVNRGGHISASDLAILEERVGPEETQFKRSNGHQREFLDMVRSRGETLCPAEVAHRSAAPGHLGQISMLLGRKIRFDPKTETIQNDPTATRMMTRAFRSPWVV